MNVFACARVWSMHQRRHMWRTDACEVKDNSDWILIKHPHPPKSPSCPLPPTCHINTHITRPDEWKWTEPWCDSPSVKSIPLLPTLLLVSRLPTHLFPLLVLLFAAIIFPSSSPLLRLKNWHVFDKGKSTPEHKSFSPYLGLFFPFLFRSLYILSWVENEQHLLLSLLDSRSKDSIIVSAAIEKSHKDSVSALFALTRAETKSKDEKWRLGWGDVKITGGGYSRGAGVDFTDSAHIISSEGFQISSPNHGLSRPSEFSVMPRYEGIVRNLLSSAVSPLSFAFPVLISICCAGFCSLHLSPALSFYISWKVAPLTPTHASYSINKSYWRDWEKRKEAKKR